MAEYLPKLSDEKRIQMAMVIINQAALNFQKEDEIIAFVHALTKRAGYTAALRNSLSAKALRVFEQKKARKKKEAAKKEIEKPILKAASGIHAEAKELLASGKLLDVIEDLVRRSGAVQLEERVSLTLAGCIGTLRGDKERSIPSGLTGSSGCGKSTIINLVAKLLPPESVLEVSSVSEAVLKRIGDKWANKILLVDELSGWLTSQAVLTPLKELLSKGSATFEIVEPDGQGWVVGSYPVQGPIGFVAGATDATLSSVLGSAEEEVRSRWNEIPVPEDKAYIRQAAAAAFRQLAPTSLDKLDPHLVEVIQEAIRIVAASPIPKAEPGFLETVPELVESSNPLVIRLLKRLSILLENTALLLGHEEIGLGAYERLYPVLSKLFRRSLSSDNDANLANFIQLADWLNTQPKGLNTYFKTAHIKEALGCGRTKSFDTREKLEGMRWIEDCQHGVYQLTDTGKKLLGQMKSDSMSLPDILPTPERLRVELEKVRTLNAIPCKPSGVESPQESADNPQDKKPCTPYREREERDREREKSGSPEKENGGKNISSEGEVGSETENSPNGLQEKNKNNFSPVHSGLCGLSPPKTTSNVDTVSVTANGHCADFVRTIRTIRTIPELCKKNCPNPPKAVPKLCNGVINSYINQPTKEEVRGYGDKMRSTLKNLVAKRHANITGQKYEEPAKGMDLENMLSMTIAIEEFDWSQEEVA